MIATNDSQTFRVIIAGGGVVGLTLANILQHAGVDYLLLEGRSEFAPPVGASIGIFPNGARILDQINCYEPLLSTTEPLQNSSFLKPDGTFVINHDQDVNLFGSRFGYDLVFQDRQALLKVLYNGITDKSKCRANCKIARVDHHDEGVVVYCEDGSSFEGDIILGSDGVRSKVRKEMWRSANEVQPGFISDKEQKAMFAEYKCLYGIANEVPGITKGGDYHCSLNYDRSMMTVVGRPERIYFFVFEKLDRVYKDGEIPRFSEAEKEAFVERNSDLLFRKGLPFRDIYKHRETSDLVCMEEAEYETWTWGRFVMVGDSIHKTTANQGAGGNQGIESAAVVGTLLKRMLDQYGPKPTLKQIQTVMAEYPKIHQKRTNKIFEGSGKLTRIHALKGLMEELLIYRLVPIAGELLLNQTCDAYMAAPYIEFLPVPERSLNNNMPFNPQAGAGKQESRLLRFFYALPLLGISYVAAQNVGMLPSTVDIDMSTAAFNSSITTQPTASVIRSSSPITDVLFLTSLAPLYAILLIEGARRSNILTPSSLPTIVALLAHRLGLEIISPFYFLLHYVFSAPIDKFACLDLRLTDLRYVKTTALSVGLFYLLPLAALSQWASHSFANQILNLCSLLVGIFQLLIAKYVLPNTVPHDKIHAPLRDLPWIRATIICMSPVPALAWWRSLGQEGFMETFVIFCTPTELNATGFATLGAALLWLCMIFGDMRRAGMIESTGELSKILVVGILVTCLAGPGTAVGLGWLWREELLATRKHWGAITTERIKKEQ